MFCFAINHHLLVFSNITAGVRDEKGHQITDINVNRTFKVFDSERIGHITFDI